MNISSAIDSMRNDGEAARPSSWRGYVERIDKMAPAYSELSTYTAASKVKVTYNGYTYMCTADTVAGPFDQNKWTRVDNDRYIVFVDAEDTGNVTPNPSAIYLGSVTDTDNNLAWGRLGTSDDIPAEVRAVHLTWSGKCPSPVDMPDAQLFAALISDSWDTGSASDYEMQRNPDSSRRW